LKKVYNPSSESTNITQIVSDSFSENKLKTPSINNTISNIRKTNNLNKLQLGTISEETKKMNDESEYFSENSNK